MTNGKLIISLDLELLWGMKEKSTQEGVVDRVRKVNEISYRLLDLFIKYDIHATWGVVGFLLFNEKKTLIEYTKDIKINYQNKKMNSYNYINLIGNNELEDPLHFGMSIVKRIASTNGQEIASHSFSHYYAQEFGQDITDFETDVRLFDKSLFNLYKRKATSYISPRFQHKEEYNKVLQEYGYNKIRGMRDQKLERMKIPNKLKIILKYLDRYINLLGYRSYKNIDSNQYNVHNIKESYYFRPYSPSRKFLEKLKIRRIKREMKYAAKHKRIFHLWWHPHDFGTFTEENFMQIECVLNEFNKLRRKYNYESVSMDELVLEI